MNHLPPNQFLHNLFSKSNALLANCGSPASLVILAPVSSALNAIDGDSGLVYAENLTDDFVQSHILHVSYKRDEVLDRAKAKVYTTINGKTMVIKEDVIYPHRGFKGVREVRLLHDSLLWPDDPNSKPYLVYFLDRPLVGALLPNVYRPRTSLDGPEVRINSWASLIDVYKNIGVHMNTVLGKLYAEFNEAIDAEDHDSLQGIVADSAGSLRSTSKRRVRSFSASSISPAPLQRSNTNQSFSSSPALQFLRVRIDLVINSAMQAFQALPQHLLMSLSNESGLLGSDIESLIESKVLHDLYDIIFFKLTLITESKDEEIAAAIEHTRSVDITQLGSISSLDLRSRLASAMTQFRNFGAHQEPLQKLQALMQTINVLMLNSEKSSDDLIPSLVAVVLRAGVSNLRSNILWIREFAFMDVDSGEYGFALSTLDAVLYHIISTQVSLSKVSTRNSDFFQAIENDDLDTVKGMVESFPELLDIRSLDNSSPHRKASDAVLEYLLSRPCNACSLSGAMFRQPTAIGSSILDRVLELNHADCYAVLNEADDAGRTLAHRIYEMPEILSRVHHILDWEKKDHQGNSALQLLARIYDHPMYDQMLETVLRVLSCGSTSDRTELHDDLDAAFKLPVVKRKIRLKKHLDSKGNTLAHIVATPESMKSVLKYCTGNFNALNHKGLTPLLISIKFARLVIVEILLSHAQIDLAARDVRGHSAIHYASRASIELFNICIASGMDINDRASGSGITPLHIAAREGNLPVLRRLIDLEAEDAWDWRGIKAGDIVKNDQTRCIMDEWACKGREVRILRGHIGEDCSVKYLIKSISGGGVLRSIAEFQKLRQWLTIKYPNMGVAALQIQLPWACLIHSRPSKAVLSATTERLDAFVQSLLDNQVIKQDPILWEFLLSPVLNEDAISRRIEKEAEAYKRVIWSDERAVPSHESTRMFFNHAREQIIQLSSTYKIFERKARAIKDSQLHLSVAYGLVGKAFNNLPELEVHAHVKALEGLSDALLAKEPSLLYRLIEDVVSLEARTQGLLLSMTLPDAIIERIESCTTEIEKQERNLLKPARIQLSLPLLLDSQSRKKGVIREELQALHIDLKHAGSELRSSEATLAGNLSIFYQTHEKTAAQALRQFAERQVGVERDRLKSMEQALAGIRSESKGMYYE